MNEQDKSLLWMNSFQIGKAKISKIFDVFASFDAIFLNFKTKTKVLIEILGEDLYWKMHSANNQDYVDALTKEIEKLKMKYITLASKEYPDSLRYIDGPPLVLFYIGDISLLTAKSISVVGTRKPSSYGKEMTEKFVSKFVDAGIVTVSGLAYGVDTVCHRITVEHGGKTIAVMAGGLDDIYPAENTVLARKIAKTGLIISEYAPKVRPTAYAFPERNRIISALSVGTIIIEASEKSGSLHTAKFALEQGKELFVVPSNLTSVANAGGNRLISEMPHCFAYSPEMVLESLGIESENSTAKTGSAQQLTFDEQKILDIVSIEETHFDNLVEKTGMEPKNLNSLLTIMEINGIIKKLPGNYIGI